MIRCKHEQQNEHSKYAQRSRALLPKEEVSKQGHGQHAGYCFRPSSSWPWIFKGLGCAGCVWSLSTSKLTCMALIPMSQPPAHPAEHLSLPAPWVLTLPLPKGVRPHLLKLLLHLTPALTQRGAGSTWPLQLQRHTQVYLLTLSLLQQLDLWC